MIQISTRQQPLSYSTNNTPRSNKKSKVRPLHRRATIKQATSNERLPKVVRFEETLQVRTFHSTNFYDREWLFYSRHDIAWMRARDDFVLGQVQAGRFHESWQETALGLEARIQEDRDPYDVIEAVLDEQDRQQEKGISNPDLLAYVYMQAQD